MKELLKKTLKLSSLWFLGGAGFALIANVAAPFLTPELAAPAAAINPIFLGALMAISTAIFTVAEPLFAAVFGEAKSGESEAREKDMAKQVNITVVQAPQQSQGQAAGNYFQQQEEQRILSASENILMIGKGTGAL